MPFILDAVTSDPGLGTDDDLFQRLVDTGYLKDWWEPDIGMGSEVVSAAISSVPNLGPVGNAGPMAQATSGRRPTFVTPDDVLLPIAHFDGTDDYLATASPQDWTVAHTWAVLFKTSTPHVAQTVMASVTNSSVREFIAINNTGTINMLLGDRALTSPLLPGLNLAILASTGDGQIKSYAGGQFQKSTIGGNNSAPTGASPSAALQLLGAYNSASQPLNGEIVFAATFNDDIFPDDDLTVARLIEEIAVGYGASPL